MASFARALLRLTAAVAAEVTVTALLVANPLTRPVSVKESATGVGAPADLLRLGTSGAVSSAIRLIVRGARRRAGS